jgi:hypothetical protein
MNNPPPPPPEAPAPSLARRLGQITQGVLLGTLLVLALFELLAQSGNLTPFKYQGF